MTNPTAPRRGKPFLILAVAAALFWLAMFLATHLPMRTTPQGDPYSLDKFQHITAFATLAALLAAVAHASGAKSWRVSLAIVGLLALYAAFDELSQSFVAQRSPEFLDWLADITGAGLGIALFHVASSLWQRRATRSAS